MLDPGLAAEPQDLGARVGPGGQRLEVVEHRRQQRPAPARWRSPRSRRPATVPPIQKRRPSRRIRASAATPPSAAKPAPIAAERRLIGEPRAEPLGGEAEVAGALVGRRPRGAGRRRASTSEIAAPTAARRSGGGARQPPARGAGAGAARGPAARARPARRRAPPSADQALRRREVGGPVELRGAEVGVGGDAVRVDHAAVRAASARRPPPPPRPPPPRRRRPPSPAGGSGGCARPLISTIDGPLARSAGSGRALARPPGRPRAMRAAVISDIHSNLPALEAVLAAIDDSEDASRRSGASATWSATAPSPTRAPSWSGSAATPA